jgi:DNA-binding GntR family transcriptional regulator
MTQEFFLVDRQSPTPIYTQIVNWISSKITTGAWPSNYKLPSEIELSDQLNVSRGSLRKAIGILIEKGLLTQVHGKGTFVSSHIFEQSWAGQMLHVSDELLMRGIPFQTKVFNKEILELPELEAGVLGVNPGHEVLYLKRLRTVDGFPIVVHESYINIGPLDQLLTVNFELNNLMDTLEALFGIKPAWAYHTIAVVHSSADIAHQLGLKIGDSVLYNDHVMYDNEERRLLFSRGWFHPDRFRLKTIVGESHEDYSRLLRHEAENDIPDRR